MYGIKGVITISSILQRVELLFYKRLNYDDEFSLIIIIISILGKGN